MKDQIEYLKRVSGTGLEIRQINQAIQLYESGEYENFLATLDYLELLNKKLLDPTRLRQIRCEVNKLTFESNKKARRDFLSCFR